MIKKIYIICFLSFVSYCSVAAQNIKRITLSADEAYTEHIALAYDSKDMDVMIKFMFDEINNRITVVLMSYRPLFVFQSDTRYKHVVKKRKLRPERLPYVVNGPVAKIPLTKALRNQISKPKREYVFKRWISYEGIQPVPEENKLVYDFIEQHFDVLQKRNEIKVALHHLFVMDTDVKSNTKQSFLLSYFKDLNVEYHISLKRNPCLGLETEMEQAATALHDVQKAYEAFQNSFGTGQVEQEEQYVQFVMMKNMLTKQFFHKEAVSKCPEIQRIWEKYNKYVDDILQLECVWIKTSKKHGVNTEILLKDARQIDNLVTNWISSKDKVEKRDIHIQCLKLIEKNYENVEMFGIANDEQEQAWDIFRKAEHYFQTTINLKE